jgi:hypothetical protein
MKASLTAVTSLDALLWKAGGSRAPRALEPTRERIPGKAAVGVVAITWIAIRVGLLFAVPDGLDTQAVPFNGFNDEPAHFNYVRYLAEFEKFPVQTEHAGTLAALRRAQYEYYQPPLYYLLAQPFYWAGAPFGEHAALLTVRAFSLLLSIVQLVTIVKITQLLAGSSRAAWMIPAFFALLPGYARFGAQVNNDCLCWTIAYLLFYEVLRTDLTDDAWGRRHPLAHAALLGALAGVGLLTKYSFIAVILGLLPRWLLSAQRGYAARAVTVFLAVAVVVAVPLYLRNHAVYGAWLPIAAGNGAPRPLTTSTVTRFFDTHFPFALRYFWCGFESSFQSFWQRATGKVLMVVHALWIALALGAWRQASQRPAPAAIGAAMLGPALTVGAAFLGFIARYGQGEARHISVIFPVMVVLLFIPIVSLADRRRGFAAVLLLAPPVLPWIGLLWSR